MAGSNFVTLDVLEFLIYFCDMHPHVSVIIIIISIILL